MNKISPLLQDLRLELYEMTTLDSGQYIMTGLGGSTYAASPSVLNDFIRRFTNNNRQRYQDRLARLIDKLMEYAELVMNSSILSSPLAKDAASPYAIREFSAKLDALEMCSTVMQTVHLNLDKVKIHYTQMNDVQFAMKVDDLRAQLQRAYTEIATKLATLQPSTTPTTTTPTPSCKTTTTTGSTVSILLAKQRTS